MEILGDFLRTLLTAFFGIFNGILKAVPSYYQIISSLNQIKQIFSVQGVLQYGFGVPEIVFIVLSCVSVCIMIFRWMLKHKLL